MKLSRTQSVISWILQIVVAVILFQTLFFKFSASKESVYIFSKLGIEPVGRIGSGIAELIASILLLTPSLTVYGAILALGDGGLLFGLALVVFFGSLGILILHRKEIPVIGDLF